MLKIAKIGFSIIIGGTMSVATADTALTSSQSTPMQTSGFFKKKPKLPLPIDENKPDTRAPQNPDAAAPIGTLPTTVKKALEQLKLDAYGTALNRDYAKGLPPLQQSSTDPEDIYFDDAKLLAKTYQCRSFGIASKNNATPPVVNLTYSFSNRGTGSLFRTNTSQEAQVRLFTYLADSKEPANLKKYDVIGQNDAQTYYEKIRVTKRGDIVIEGSTPEKFWAETLLSMIGLLIPDFDKYKDAIDKELDHLKLKVTLAGLSGMVLRYTYCPNNPAAFHELDMQAQTIMMDKIQNDPQYKDLQGYQNLINAQQEEQH